MRPVAVMLDALAEHLGESRNALADRVLGEALRTQAHPLVRFRAGASGRREPAVGGTRLLVRQVVRQVRDENGDIDADAEWAARVEAEELARWQREQAVLT